MKGGSGRSACGTVARSLSLCMSTQHLPVEALASSLEAANGARFGMQRPDGSAQDGIGRRSRGKAEALIGRIGHVR